MLALSQVWPPSVVHEVITQVLPTQVALAWTSLCGRSYRLHYRESLTAPWNTSGDRIGSGDAVTVTDTLGPAMRFYRLELLP